MVAEILAVGTELLLGDIVNTNAQYLSKQLAELGISVYYQTVVGDNADRLLKAYENAFSRADIVITTGGLGPTEDDLTKEIGAKYFNKQLVEDEASMKWLVNYFKNQHFVMTENNKKQAFIPEGAQVLENGNGTAPGCLIEENGKMLIMLPGPPAEAIPMFETTVLPILKTRTNFMFFSKTLRICGVGESMVEEIIKDLIDSQTNPTIAPYAKASEVTLRITAQADNEEQALEIMEPTISEIYKRLGENIYGENEITLEGAVVELLKEKKLTIACAESCTGGLLTAKLVDCPGVSEILLEGVVTYSNESKMKRLGVKEDTLNQFGAVSEETAVEMAKGVAESAGADIGISTTGIAGPDGGTDDKPVGTIFICLYINGKTLTKKLNFKGSREKIRMRTVVYALDFLRREILR